MPERAHDLGLDDAAVGVDGDVHRQLAVQLLALVLGEVARAALLDLAAQRVVVERVDLFARRRADVALLRPRVLLVDALLDLGQQLDQLAPPLFLLALLGRACVALRVGRRQQRQLAPDLRQQLLLLLLQLLDLLARVLGRRRRSRSAPTAAAARWRGPCRPRRRRPGWPARSPAPSSGASSERELTRITSSGVSWNIAVEALRVDEAHRQQRARARATEMRQRDLQRARAARAMRASAAPARRRPASRLRPARRRRATSIAMRRAGRRRLGSRRPRLVGVARRVAPACVVEARDHAARARRASAGRCAPMRTRTRAAARQAARRRARGTPAAACRRAPGRPSSPWRRARATPFCCS